MSSSLTDPQCIDAVLLERVSPRVNEMEGVELCESQNQNSRCDDELDSTFEFPATPSKLVSCGESPDLGRLSKLEDAINQKEGSLSKGKKGFPKKCLQVSFQLLDPPQDTSDDPRDECSLMSINAGELESLVVCDGIDFQKDQAFVGGEIVRTDEIIGDGKWVELFRTARVGNCLYKFDRLEPGDYVIDMHFAEIIFTHGPPGLRTFDVFIQGEKVVSGLDIYAQVGPNQPLTLSDLKATVVGSEGLTIRLEEVNGEPIVSGISIRHSPSSDERLHRIAEQPSSQSGEPHTSKTECFQCKKLRREYDLLNDMHIGMEKLMKDIEMENEAKSRECHEAWMSLRDLQSELMRKSMHVGSLAFAVEGQVKEKTRWFSALRDLSDKVEIVKVEHSELLEWGSKYRDCIADMETLAASVQFALKDQSQLIRENEELKEKFLKETKIRRELYNKVLEVKGNIRVFCRCRPLNEDELSRGISMVVDFESAKDGELVVRAPNAPKRTFKFDSVFSPEADQESVFEDTSPLAMSVLDGYNVCIFAYGQTGTGKTFTMEGTENARGVNYRTLEELFRIIKERQDFCRYEVSVSVLEVYNEQIRDLLLSDSEAGVITKRLDIRKVSDGTHCIPGLVEASVSNVNEVWEVLKTGGNARAVGSTNANEHSSRSHCIHCVMVKGENLINGECTRSKLWLIDLAGSERVAKTDAQGERLKEAQCINKSLSALGDVISALATKSPHIPFRNSKLTHLLQDSLGGDSKALMFVQISPSENDVSETLCSLNFASRVRGIELGPAKKQFDGSEISRHKQMLERAKQEMKVKDMHIKKMDETVQCLELKMKGKDVANRNLQDKIKELESQLLIERKLARQHIDAKISEQLQQQKCHMQHQQKEEPDTRSQMAFREISNTIAPCTTDNLPPMPTSDFPRKLARLKENKPELVEAGIRKARRLTLCPTSERAAPILQNARRITLCPLPVMEAMQPLPELPFRAIVDGNEHERAQELREPRSAKRSNSILRRSLQKKVMIRPMMQQQLYGSKRGGGGLSSGGLGGASKMMRARRVPISKVPGNAASELLLKRRIWN